MVCQQTVRQDIVNFLLYGVPSNDPVAEDFEAESLQATAFSVLLLGVYLSIAGPAYPLLVLYVGLPITVRMMTVLIIPSACGIGLLFGYWKVCHTARA